jgi:serine/threonine protein kinase
MTNLECPRHETLRNYALGNCGDSLADEIEGHLSHCPACEATIAQFDSADDTLMRHLPLAAAVTGDSPPAAAWIDVLREQPPLEQGTGTQERPTAKPQSGAASEAAVLPDGFANYELLGVIGRGGMGVVFLARHRQLNRRVALKVVRPEALSSSEARRRFAQEIRILGGLNHPGIVMATDAGTVGSGAYLVMELIDGADLGRVVREGGPLTIEAACEAGRQIAEALAAAHAGSAVHRDVKPSNIMVDRAGRVRLLDFGLAQTARVIYDSGETSVGRLLGTLDYMAPEQADGRQAVDERADLYGLGATFFFLLTGQPPHGARAGRSILEHLRAIAHDDAPLVSSLRVDVPQELDHLVARLLSRDPAGRPESAAQVASALGRWAGGSLAARIADLKVSPTKPESESGEGIAARQSLAELLGTDLSNSTNTPLAMGALRPALGTNRPRWRGLRTAAALTLAGAILAGVTIWLQTKEGKLRIDSEVGDVTVEVRDEQDQIRELRIHKGENETVLEAGKYRVRLAGTHDDVDLDRDEITLRRGKDALAKITRVAQKEPDVVAAATGREKPGPGRKRLYLGKDESEWQLLFEAEIAPLSKLEAGGALLVMAGELPPEAQLQHILDVGEEIVRATFGDASLEFALEGATNPPIHARRWRLNEGGKLYGAFQAFQINLNDQVRKLPAEVLARGLSQAVLEGNEPRAAFAASLLSYAAKSPIESDPVVQKSLLATLDVPLKGLDRSAICLLLRAQYAQKATSEERRNVLKGLIQLAKRLQDSPAENLQNQMRGRLMNLARYLYGPDWPPELSKALAQMVLKEIIEQPNALSGRFPFTLQVTESRPPYGSGYVAEVRKQMQPFLDLWVEVANQYLEEHRDTPSDEGVLTVVNSLDMVLRIYSEGDNWPVERTAALTSDLLRPYYTDAKLADELDNGPHWDVPHTLVKQFVRINGQIPEFVRPHISPSPSVAEELKKLDVQLANLHQKEASQNAGESLAKLISAAPYDAIQFCIVDEKLGVSSVVLVEQHIRKGAMIDPLLLLAMLVELTGKNESQDARIASFFNLEKGFNDQLLDLLSGSLKAGAIARQLLEKMAASSKSDQLTEAVRKLLPERK